MTKIPMTFEEWVVAIDTPNYNPRAAFAAGQAAERARMLIQLQDAFDEITLALEEEK